MHMEMQAAVLKTKAMSVAYLWCVLPLNEQQQLRPIKLFSAKPGAFLKLEPKEQQ